MAAAQLDADGRLLSALGAVTIDFSMLDAALQLAISLMMMPQTSDIVAGLDAAERNMILTAEMSFKQRVYAFASVFRHRWQKELTPEFETLCKHLHESEDKRNQLVHSSYRRGIAHPPRTHEFQLPLEFGLSTEHVSPRLA